MNAKNKTGTDKSKKEYIINFRVSQETYDRITSSAKKHGKTVSALVRDVFDDGHEILNSISEDLFGASDPRQKISSYHEAILAKTEKCSVCEKTLKEGTSISVGETPRGRNYYFCVSCLKK